MVQSPGVPRAQVIQAGEISIEFNVINAWLGQILHDARQLVALDNPHLVQNEGIRLRGEINSLATRVLNGGSDPSTGRAEKGVTAVAEQIQQLATMDITRY